MQNSHFRVSYKNSNIKNSPVKLQASSFSGWKSWRRAELFHTDHHIYRCKTMAFYRLENWKKSCFLQVKHAFLTREGWLALQQQSRTISQTDPGSFRSMEGLIRIEWTSESRIKALLQAAGWPSALLWHKHRGHVLLLSAGGTPPHILREKSTLAPYSWSVVLVFQLLPSQGQPLIPSQLLQPACQVTFATYRNIR